MTTEASILPTGGIAGLLYSHGVDHPWLGPATEFCWQVLDQIPERVARDDDGGSTVNWQIWTPVVGPEWRGWQTVERLKTLHAYGRLDR